MQVAPSPVPTILPARSRHSLPSAAEGSPPRERASPAARRGRVTNLRQREEGRRERRKREALESELPWRFAPADLDDRFYAPYDPGFYWDRD